MLYYLSIYLLHYVVHWGRVDFFLLIYSVMILFTNLLYYDFINILYSAILGFIVLGSKVVAVITPTCGGKVFCEM